jgi:hypothetical protein
LVSVRFSSVACTAAVGLPQNLALDFRRKDPRTQRELYCIGKAAVEMRIVRRLQDIFRAGEIGHGRSTRFSTRPGRPGSSTRDPYMSRSHRRQDGAAPAHLLCYCEGQFAPYSPVGTRPGRVSKRPIDGKWWSRRDLNPRPLRCERSALPAELLPHPGFSSQSSTILSQARNLSASSGRFNP